MPSSWRYLVVGGVCFALGFGWAYLPGRSVTADTRVTTPPFSMRDRLGGNLYMQNAAEYRACCLQVYQCAEERLQTLLKSKPAKPAVVMDLDETVFDNSVFQTFLYKNQLEYEEPLWLHYEDKFSTETALVPGAKHFIIVAAAAGVDVVFLSNRSQQYEAATEAALKRLGLPNSRLYLKSKEGGSDKSARREQIAAKYNVLMYFGDNLRDFSEVFAAPKLGANATPEALKQAMDQRFTAVDDARCHWGVDWFVLPNSSYGEWDKLLGADPLLLLRETKMERPGAK